MALVEYLLPCKQEMFQSLLIDNPAELIVALCACQDQAEEQFEGRHIREPPTALGFMVIVDGYINTQSSLVLGL
jgi:hypothetical protein